MSRIEIRDEYAASEVRGMNLEIGYANLIVREEVTDKIAVATMRDEEKSAKYNCNLTDGVLQVEAGNMNVTISIFGKEGTFRKGEMEKDEVCITVPCGMKFEFLELSLGAGNAKLSNVTSEYKRAELKVGAGTLVADGVRVEGVADISLGAGTIEVKNLFAQNADLDCGVGNMKIAGAVEHNIEAGCGVGNINLYLDAVESDYNYDIDCAVGSVIINGNKRGGLFASSSNVASPNAKGTIDLDCGVGKIELCTQKRIAAV